MDYDTKYAKLRFMPHSTLVQLLLCDNGVAQTLVHMVASTCKSTIVSAYILTFVTVKYILYRIKILILTFLLL